MAAYISVPRDLTKVKSKVAFNLTKRQLLCFGTAALIGVPLFFLLRDSGGNSAATLGMMAVMLPAFFLGMYEKNGQPLEKLQLDTERDNYMSAQQAKEYGLIDEVITHR